MRTVAIAALVVMSPAAALAQSVPLLMPVQGILTDADDVRLDGTFNVTFTQWDAETGGNVLLEETLTLDVSMVGSPRTSKSTRCSSTATTSARS